MQSWLSWDLLLLIPSSRCWMDPRYQEECRKRSSVQWIGVRLIVSVKKEQCSHVSYCWIVLIVIVLLVIVVVHCSEYLHVIGVVWIDRQWRRQPLIRHLKKEQRTEVSCWDVCCILRIDDWKGGCCFAVVCNDLRWLVGTDFVLSKWHIKNGRWYRMLISLTTRWSQLLDINPICRYHWKRPQQWLQNSKCGKCKLKILIRLTLKSTLTVHIFKIES